MPTLKNAGDFKCTMPSWLCSATQPKHTLQMFADHYGPEIPLHDLHGHFLTNVTLPSR